MELAPKVLYSRQEAAEMLSISLSSLQELMHRGLVKGIRKGHRLLIHRDEIERFAKQDVPQIWKPKQNGKTVRFGATAREDDAAQLRLA